MLLLIFFLFGSNFVLKSGVSVALPQSGSELPSALQSHIITIVPGEKEIIYFNEEKVSIEQLEQQLKDGAGRSRQIILLADREVRYGVVMQVSQLGFRFGYEISFATQEERNQ